METTEFTRITAEVSGREKITVEFPNANTTVSDICQAFRIIMVGMTFTDEQAGKMIASYLEEYYRELYSIERIKE